MKADASLDCFGLLCPMPMINTAKKMKDLQAGQILEIIATDEGVKTDIPSWCRATGSEFLGIEEKNGEFHAFVKKT